MTEQAVNPKRGRLEHANALIKAISDHGRRFFFDRASGRIAKMHLDQRGRIWFVDDYSNKPIYTHKTPFGNDWRGFSHGGTLRSMVESMRDYIQSGQQIQAWRIAPTRLCIDNDDIWGYGPKARDAVRKAACALPIIQFSD